MMEEPGCPPSSLTTNLAIHENERCWIGKGFGKRGLLPNDPSVYATEDGSISFQTLTEATAFLMTPGWLAAKTTTSRDNADAAAIDDAWIPEGDGDQWWYARDFSKAAARNAKAYTRGPLHWVRFRLLHMPVMFDSRFMFDGMGAEMKNPSHQSSSGDHFDSKLVHKFAELLLHLLAYRVALKKGQTTMTASSVIPLKRELLSVLVKEVRGDDDNRSSSKNENDDAFCRLAFLESALISAMEKCQSKSQVMSLISQPARFHQRTELEHFDTCCSIITERHFTLQERELVAQEVIRRIDSQFQLHCSKQSCGVAAEDQCCKFALLPCPHAGCTTTSSHMYREEHDATCPFKVLTCDCGDSYVRHRRLQHVQQVCPLREAVCPFQCIGCTAIVAAQDMADHVANETSSHLLLSMHRMLEYESVLRDLRTRVDVLERGSSGLAQQLTRQQTRLADLSSIDKTVAKLQHQMKSMDSNYKKEAKRIGEIEKKMKQHEQHSVG